MTRPPCFIDFETRSAVDLRKTGAYVYAEDPSTDLWCIAYAFGDEPIEMWLPGQAIPPWLKAHVEAGGELVAHNSAFERVIWWAILTPRYGWPRPKTEQFRCTMAGAMAMSLPGSLEKAAAAVGLEARKDMSGHRVMLQASRPRKIEADGTLIWWDDAERQDKLRLYCRNDVEVERQLDKRLARLSPYETKIFHLDAKINDRGVRVDLALCRAAQRVIEHHSKLLDAEMREVTGFEVNSCDAVQQLVRWLRKQGVDTSSVSKETVVDLLGEDLPPDAERALKLRQEAAKASTAKIAALIARTSPDGRMRGNLCYHGASTGRWAGRGAQLQNLPKATMAVTEQDIANLRTGDPVLIGMLYDRPLTLVADCIRSTLVSAAGKDLIASDFAQIEARVLAWLAEQSDLLELFAKGGKIYEAMAAKIYGVKPEEIEPDGTPRSLGKASILGGGFGMGPAKFRATCKKSGLIISQELAELTIGTYRKANAAIVRFWKDLETTAIDAVRRPGEITICGRIKYRKHGSFLVCQLPGGRCIYYPYPRLVKNVWIKDLKTNTKRTMRLDAAREAQTAGKVKIDGEPYDSLTYKGVDTYTKKWQEIDTYGGKLVENVTQATARDLMADAMLRVDEAGYPVILTVHDEVLSEPAVGFGSAQEFDEIMSQLPAWAAGCPVSAKGWRGARYRK